eukprot:3627558-Prymnesium_polylepis.1
MARPRHRRICRIRRARTFAVPSAHVARCLGRLRCSRPLAPLARSVRTPVCSLATQPLTRRLLPPHAPMAGGCGRWERARRSGVCRVERREWVGWRWRIGCAGAAIVPPLSRPPLRHLLPTPRRHARLPPPMPLWQAGAPEGNVHA